MIWVTMTWLEVLWRDLRCCDLIWGTVTWREVLSCDLRCCDVTWDTVVCFEVLWRYLMYCDVIWDAAAWSELLCRYRTHFRRLVLVITAMITQNRLAQFLNYHTIFTWSRVYYFSLARLETRTNCVMSVEQVLGIQSLNKRLIKFVNNLIFIGRFRCFFTSARRLETFYWL